LDAAEAVCNVGNELGCDVMDEMETLVDNSLLLQSQDADGQTRFGMLETIREYANERLHRSNELDQIRHQHALYFLDFARKRHVPVVHLVMTHRRVPGLGTDAMISPFWQALHAAQGENDRLVPGRKSTVKEHNVEGSRGTEIMPELFAAGDYVVDSKKRLDCFYATDLQHLLQVLKVRSVVLMGINTNTCVLNTAFTAFNLGYRVVVLSDCVASMYGDDLHVLGLQNVARCLGWVVTNEQFFAKLEEERSHEVHA